MAEEQQVEQQDAGINAALKALQDKIAEQERELSEKNQQLTLQDQKAKLQDEELAAAAKRAAELAAINKQLDDAKRAAEERAEASSPGANMSQASSKARYRIIIEEGRDPADNAQDVPVGVNGRAYKCRRGVEIDVPYDVIEVLNNAVAGRGDSIMDAGGISSGVKFTEGRRFPFRIIGQVIDEKGEVIPNGPIAFVDPKKR